MATFADRLNTLNVNYLINKLSELAKIPTDVPLGFDTLMDADDPKLVHYVQHVIRPELVNYGYWDLIDAPLNNLVVRTGKGESGRSMLLVNYTPAQHNNLMDNPFSGKIGIPSEFGIDTPAVFGQGVSQNKVHQAVMLTVLKLIAENDIQLEGTLYWAVNNEGRSSHECANAIMDSLPETPDFGVIQIPTDFAISLGNRGRVDIDVVVDGMATHSSAPELGVSAIEGAAEVVERLKSLQWSNKHPQLGSRHALVYKVQYEPIAPHTIPSSARLTIDRRLLPGDTIEDALAEVQSVLEDMEPFSIRVEPNVFMMPALVDPIEPGVAALRTAHESTFGVAPTEKYFQGSFDAAGFCERGVPTVMYGGGGGVFPVGPDFVTVEHAVQEAKSLATLIFEYLE